MTDLWCGTGISTTELAKRYPMAKFYGFDRYHKNVSTAQENARKSGVEGNTEFKLWQVADGSPGAFDVVATFDLIHDLPNAEEGITIV